MSLLNAHPTVEVNKKIRAEDFNILPIYTTPGLAYNAEHSGDLGMATEEPWKGRPAVIGRVLLRLVKGLFTLGFYWAPNAECQLPILCAILTHCARNQATE